MLVAAFQEWSTLERLNIVSDWQGSGMNATLYASRHYDENGRRLHASMLHDWKLDVGEGCSGSECDIEDTVELCSLGAAHGLPEASVAGNLRCVRALLSAQADVNAAGMNGETPLILAAQRGHASVVGALLRHGADHATRDAQGFSPLLYASQAGHQRVVEILIRHRVDVDGGDMDGFTPLMYASASGHVACVEALVAAGADQQARAADGTAARQLAELEQHSEVLAILD